MLKLSQRGWNNIIIISMLMLIFIFNFSSNLLNGSADEQDLHVLIPADSIITTIEFDGYKVERIGQSWRTVPKKADNDALVQLIDNWMTAEVLPVGSEQVAGADTSGKWVKVWLAGQEDSLNYLLFVHNGHSMVLTNKGVYKLLNQSYQSLNLAENKDA